MARTGNVVALSDGIDPKKLALPDIYTKAVMLIKDTITLDESKQWVDKSEALAAWASMYNDDQVGVAAKRLRLHAYRRMGELAQSLRPTKTIKGGGRTPGPNSLLREAGLSRHGANAAVALAKADEIEVQGLIDSDAPVSPTTFERRAYAHSGLAAFRNNQRTPFSCRIFLREVTPEQAAKKLNPLERAEAVKQLKELSRWIEQFCAAVQTGLDSNEN